MGPAGWPLPGLSVWITSLLTKKLRASLSTGGGADLVENPDKAGAANNAREFFCFVRLFFMAVSPRRITLRRLNVFAVEAQNILLAWLKSNGSVRFLAPCSE